MISLKNLHEATAQQVFDQAVGALLRQGKQSMKGGACVYRKDDCTACVAGHLIADDEYSKIFEGQNWHGLTSTSQVPVAHKDLIFSMQIIHDQLPDHLLNDDTTDAEIVEHWRNEFRKLALSLNLSCTIVDTYNDKTTDTN